MKILKNIINFIMITINIVLYIISAFTSNKIYFTIFTIVIISLLLWNTYKKIKYLNNLSSKISKLLRYI